MKITVINGSPRVKGNTEIMVEAFVRGAEEKGHRVEVIPLSKNRVDGCLGCNYCMNHEGCCVQKDDMQTVLESTDEADLVVFASPIYWANITGQLKCVIDRLYCRGRVGFHFTKAALLLDAAVEDIFTLAVQQFEDTCRYRQWENLGVMTLGGMSEKGSMRLDPRLKQVYEFGRSL